MLARRSNESPVPQLEADSSQRSNRRRWAVAPCNGTPDRHVSWQERETPRGCRGVGRWDAVVGGREQAGSWSVTGPPTGNDRRLAPDRIRRQRDRGSAKNAKGTPEGPFLERETGFEPATSTLARLHSTAELFPQKDAIGSAHESGRQAPGAIVAGSGGNRESPGFTGEPSG